RMWIFGYGSLVWKADFPYEEKLYGYVLDYARRFWQSSPDHRGTPDLPGRTVTLVPSPGERVWGAAYRLAEDEVARVRSHLDEREKAGYGMLPIQFYPADRPGQPLAASVYVNSGERHYLGPQTVPSIAERVAIASGASGPNTDYVLRLAAAMRDIGAPDALDPHLAEVEAAVLLLLGKHNGSSATR
ncbi:hypothetical protein BOX15_Mlig014504g4, partial [Macrostomum lignano]